MDKYTRKELAELFNIGKETLRYYENINLLPNATRNKSGYRVYSEEDVLRVKFILQMKEYGFSLREISDFIKMVSNDKCANQDKLVEYIDNKITGVVNHIKELYQFDDYSKYVSTAFDANKKLKCRKEVFPEDCKKAFELGKRLVQM